MGYELLDGALVHRDVFGMHFVTFDFFALYRLEGTGTYVEGQLFAVDTPFVEGFQHPFGKMKSGGNDRVPPYAGGVSR